MGKISQRKERGSYHRNSASSERTSDGKTAKREMSNGRAPNERATSKSQNGGKEGKVKTALASGRSSAAAGCMVGW